MKRYKIQAFLPAVLLIAVILLWGEKGVKADSYEEFVDPFTGLSESEMYAEEKNGEVTITSSMKYDSLSNRFIYYIPESDSLRIISNVADGMYLSSPAEINFSIKGSGTVYHDGKEITEKSQNTFSDTGRYDVRINAGGEERTVFSFTIVGEKINNIYSYNIPEGFSLKSVLWNENEKSVNSSYVDLTEEGIYKITYQCNRTGIPYVLETEIDRTAPVLLLNGVVDGIAEGPVDISDYGEENKVLIYLNNEQTKFSTELTVVGSYRILISDPAGNTTEYIFDIIPYLNTNAKIVIAALIIAIVALGIYLYVGKKKLRVR